jgi:hypothetical protein
LKDTSGMLLAHSQSSRQPRRSSPRTRRSLAASTPLVLALCLAGCSAFDALIHRGQAGPYAIALHRLADAGSLPGTLTRVVADASGTRRVCIRSMPILSNQHIQSGQIEETEDPNRPTLRLFLNRQGSIVWSQICQETPGDTIAVLLDDFFWHALVLPRPLDTASIVLQGRLGRTEAQAVADSLSKQYRRLNPSTKLF